MITLNVNGLNSPVKRHMAGWVEKNKTKLNGVIKRFSEALRMHIYSTRKDGKDTTYRWKLQ